MRGENKVPLKNREEASAQLSPVSVSSSAGRIGIICLFPARAVFVFVGLIQEEKKKRKREQQKKRRTVRAREARSRYNAQGLPQSRVAFLSSSSRSYKPSGPCFSLAEPLTRKKKIKFKINNNRNEGWGNPPLSWAGRCSSRTRPRGSPCLIILRTCSRL